MKKGGTFRVGMNGRIVSSRRDARMRCGMTRRITRSAMQVEDVEEKPVDGRKNNGSLVSWDGSEFKTEAGDGIYVRPTVS